MKSLPLPDSLTRALKSVPGRLQERLPGRRTRDPSQKLGDALSAGDKLDKQLQERLERQLILPCASESDEETSRAAVQDYGQFLARQDRWDELARLIREVDRNRDATPCAMSHAELLCYGARADVVHYMEDAIFDGASPVLDGIEAFEEMLSEYPDEYPLAVIVALTHADIGWVWRGGDWPHEIPERNLRLFEAHFHRAAEILGAYDSVIPDAPLLAAARCTLLAGRPLPAVKLADRYEQLITLDPGNPRPMRALGVHLLPRWHGAYDQLELEARRIAAATQSTWGNGAYAWVFMDALTVDPSAARIVDTDFFLDGMRDILANRPGQHFANLLAAYAAISMSPDRLPEGAPDIQRDIRRHVHATLDWILSEYLYELHPLVWAQAAMGPDARAPLPMRKTLMRRGLVTARHAIARHFAEEIMRGTTIAFSPHGLRFYTPM
ncbi:hypothetical protein [Marimonas arenosa]|uniref:DUF4034 domain-containing protein n=1 Tax=Marimonas arenosa TaxID=1795305 RepID=A0AAE3WH71_9RHOB|nr:hypothetical protein [Marimonas arenosa]MDQ2091543.1 hypothetical protein [Marimonas arenosa]